MKGDGVSHPHPLGFVTPVHMLEEQVPWIAIFIRGGGGGGEARVLREMTV